MKGRCGVMKRLIDKLTRESFSLLEVIVLAIWVSFSGNSAPFSLHTLIMLAILIAVVIGTLFVEDFLRRMAGLSPHRKHP